MGREIFNRMPLKMVRLAKSRLGLQNPALFYMQEAVYKGKAWVGVDLAPHLFYMQGSR